ncbi:hypothetical protein AKJ18_06415 [Vibrio xuii]|nr:hypothetical protein AKJ18_06415 [Vibrio xuii]
MYQLAVLLLICLISLPTMVFASVNVSESLQTKPLVVGLISTKPQKRIRKTTPFVDYLAKKMAPFGYTHGEVIVVTSLNEMADLLNSGKVHLTTSTVYSALLLERMTDIEFVGLRWKKGASQYHSVIFSSKNSDIKVLDDLKGKTIAFEKATSTSGFFLPANYLLSQGYQLQKMSTLTEKPAKGNIGYLFVDQLLNSSDELNIAVWTFHQKLDASVFSNLNWVDPNDAPEAVKNGLSVIGTTPAYPRSLMLSGPELNGDEVDMIKQVMYQAHTDREGKESLTVFQKTTKIEPISEGLNQAIEEARSQLSDITHLSQ